MAPTIYLIMRKDLLKLPNWTFGSILAQSGHVFCKLMVEHFKNPKIIAYTEDINNMTKVVLSVKNKSQLNYLKTELNSQNIIYSSWVEQPENEEICIATLPYEPEEIRPFLRRCSLY